jgi:TonB family protein
LSEAAALAVVEPSSSAPVDAVQGPAARIGRVLVAGSGDELVPSHQVGPDFGPGVMNSLRKGMALVRFAVQPDGSVSGAEVVRSSHEQLNPAALAAVSQWRFRPITRVQTAVVELGFSVD